MHRLLAAALTCVLAAGLAVGAGLGIVAALNATPEQPNVPLVHFHSSPDEIPGLGESALPSPSPEGSEDTGPAGDTEPSADTEPSGGTEPSDDDTERTGDPAPVSAAPGN
ncbi:hypothetical protein MMF93_10445 [Streptomyces tubbatahanensis]|uniref:Small secreted hydrophilic protein n=1 Tax=Streptomyces tubbatahanensis TaxID=2923272 RepID=A0ABY3XR64_9ACTN|nr:hypothetical protein [Streptomyces tubbatahanensis]UNS96885.1 hypothetical protein MMF93_10445 [Streptomyces tubbatahanensis]